MKKIFRDLLNEIDDFEQTAEGQAYDLRLDLADIIHRRLKSRGWTQKQLADAAGMKAPLLTRIMHSTTNCTFETAARILFALGVRGKLVDTSTIAGARAADPQHVKTAPATNGKRTPRARQNAKLRTGRTARA